jgi:CubicO group peptidase (beta-lactamase class C family)
VLQQLGGVPYAVYLDQTILKPMGLEHTLYCSVEPLIRNRAAGYSVTSDEVINASFLSMHLPGAAGALCSTVGDLLRWQQALVGGRVVRPETYRQMTTPAVLRDGTHPTYGFALGLYTLHGHAAVEHSGGINGFSADLAYYPADSLSIVVLMNSDGGDASLLARRIAELVMHTPDEGSLDLAVDASSAQRYVGTYAAQAGRPRIEQRGSRLVLVEQDEHPLQFQGHDRFVIADDHDTQLRFTVVDGRARALTITDPDGTPHEFARAADAALPSKQRRG